MGQPYHALPLELDAGDPNFSSRMRLWAFSATCEMKLVAATQKTITTSRALMAEADRVLASDGDESKSTSRAAARCDRLLACEIGHGADDLSRGGRLRQQRAIAPLRQHAVAADLAGIE